MSLSIQLIRREDFESRCLYALVGAGAMALVAGVARQVLRVPVEPGYFALAAAAVTAVKPQPAYSALMRAAVVLLPALPYVFGLPYPLQHALAGAIAAGLLAWRGHGRDGVGTSTQLALSAGAAAVTTVLGLYVQEVFDARFLPSRGYFPLLVDYAVVALFWSIGTLPVNLAIDLDAVAARGMRLEATLTGEVRGLVTRALGLYRQSQAEARKLATGEGRVKLERVLVKLAQDAFNLAESHTVLEGQLSAASQGSVDSQVQELRKRAADAQDGVARRQLERAAASLGEELNHLDALSRRRERLHAQLHAQVALLERARVCFIGARAASPLDGGDRALALADKLSALDLESASSEALPPQVRAPAVRS
ncbi:hypothetical protein D7V97_15925 [Corallococcus sp. CA053C]|uniref:hypothetical protein n=1 Tax=Corallococcus sp. CA053C TaxID=2316732 RepID=UPI000EA18C92|nr:hypothetical protein [Corallococcus sp. CA053C]RKH09630.1 hypothetical protein D7V97_15925 [Corallococcus sp. CA053C]